MTLVMSAGGAVPGFFLIPFKFADRRAELTRTSHVGGNSIGQIELDDRKPVGEVL